MICDKIYPTARARNFIELSAVSATENSAGCVSLKLGATRLLATRHDTQQLQIQLFVLYDFKYCKQVFFQLLSWINLKMDTECFSETFTPTGHHIPAGSIFNISNIANLNDIPKAVSTPNLILFPHYNVQPVTSIRPTVPVYFQNYNKR